MLMEKELRGGVDFDEIYRKKGRGDEDLRKPLNRNLDHITQTQKFGLKYRHLWNVPRGGKAETKNKTPAFERHWRAQRKNKREASSIWVEMSCWSVVLGSLSAWPLVGD